MRMSPPLAVTEDTPADMLAGSMDLDIVLPSGQSVRTSVLRSTPMMDLLVQVTTAHRLSPGSHSLQAMGERGALPYKPSTPIGALEAFTVRIVQKKTSSLKKAPQAPQTLPVTFRLQVHLPRDQLFVVRVSPQVTVDEILKQVCREKNLNMLKYELRNTGNLNQPLEAGSTLGQLNTQELTLVVLGADHLRHLSSADIMQVKEANNKDNSVCDSSLSSGSLGSRSISPVVMPAPQPPQRKKRRPAPKPPEAPNRSVVISHSRESSDSSGYHEPSTLSESPTHGGPPSDISNVESRANRGLSNMTARNSHSLSNLTSLPGHRLLSSASVTSLSSNGANKKKKAPPPPPIAKILTEVENEVKMKSLTLPAETRRKPETVVVPPPPVELAPSPPTSPDVSPIPLPRMVKASFKSEEPVVTPRKSPPQKLSKQSAFDNDEERTGSLSTRENAEEKGTKRSERDLKTVISTGTGQNMTKGVGNEDINPEKIGDKVELNETDRIMSEHETEVNQAELLSREIDGPDNGSEWSERNLDEASQGSDWESNVKCEVKLGETGDVAEFNGLGLQIDKHIISSKSPPTPPQPDWDESPTIQTKPPLFEKPKHLKASQSSYALLHKKKIDPVVQNTHSSGNAFGTILKEGVEFHSIYRCYDTKEIVENDVRGDNEKVEGTEENHSLTSREEDGNILDAEDTDAVLTSESPSSLEEPPIEEDSPSDSLTVEWEYQLPPPPTHFRDMTTPGSPTSTDAATLGTFTPTETDKPVNGVNRALHPLNGIYEDVETENNKTQEEKNNDEPDRVNVPKKAVTNAAKVLVHKTEVMNELTNLLSRNREKSQSFSNLYFPAALPEGKKKSHTLSHSQSFLNPPISNFKISSYESRMAKTVEDMEFKKPIAPANRPNGVRRADSMHGAKRVSLDNVELLQQQFLQFLQEKNMLEDGVDLKNFNVLSNIIPMNIPVQEATTDDKIHEKSESKVMPLVLDEIERTIKTPAVSQPKKIITEVDSTKEVTTEVTSKKSSCVSVTEIQMPDVSSTIPGNGSLIKNNMTAEPSSAVTKVFVNEMPKKEEVVIRRPAFKPPSISMGTWGERPKTNIVIKDEDYTTQVNTTEKPQYDVKTHVPAFAPRASSPEKKTVIAIKKPTNYKLFSALPKRKEQELETEREDFRLPKVCAVELKKEFRAKPDLIEGLQTESIVSSLEDSLNKLDVPKTTSVYVNGFTKPQSKNVEAQNATKVRPGLMPVVKGFRSNQSPVNVPDTKPQPLKKQESAPEGYRELKTSETKQKKESVIIGFRETRRQISEPLKGQGIPPPPPMESIILSPVGKRQLKPKVDADPRSELLEQIRSFGGLNRLRKTVQ